MLRREYPCVIFAEDSLPAYRVDLLDALYFVFEEDDSDGGVAVCRIDLHRLSSAPEVSGLEHQVVALVVVVQKPRHESPAVPLLAYCETKNGILIVLSLSKAIYARYTGNYDDVAPLEQGLCRGKAKLLDAFVYRGILLNINVLRRHIGLRLVIIVIADEIFHRAVREKRPELAAQLRRQRLVVGDDQRGPLHPLDDLGHGKGFAAAGHAQEHLQLIPPLHALRQKIDGLGLVSLGLEGGNHLEFIHARLFYLKIHRNAVL